MAFISRHINHDIYDRVDKDAPIITQAVNFYINTQVPDGLDHKTWQKGSDGVKQFGRYCSKTDEEAMLLLASLLRYSHQENIRRLPKYDLDFIQDVEFNIQRRFYDTAKKTRQKHVWRLYMILLECVESNR